MTSQALYQLIFYVPETHVDAVKQAIFNAGAGRYQDYDCCAWQTKGEGQYRPLAGSQPFKGQQDTLEKATEYKVETIVKNSNLEEVLKVLTEVHPYEEPAYSFWPVNNNS